MQPSDEEMDEEGSEEGREDMSDESAHSNSGCEDNTSSDDEYVVEVEELDDETTLIEEEAKEPIVDRDEELALLQSEADLPIEELRARYASMQPSDEEMDEEGSEEGREDMSDEMVVSNDYKGQVTDNNSQDTVGAALRRLEAADERARSVHVSMNLI